MNGKCRENVDETRKLIVKEVKNMLDMKIYDKLPSSFIDSNVSLR